MPLPPLQNEPLGALADGILEGAPAAQKSRGALLTRCDARLRTLPPPRRARIGTGLDLLGSRVAAVLAGCPPRPIARLSAVERRRCLDAWTESALPPIRSAWQAVRRRVPTVPYARPEVAAAIGYDGPFQMRRQFRSFEGPRPDGPRATPTEPVARGPVILPGELPHEHLPGGVSRGIALAADLTRRADVVVLGTGAGGAVACGRRAPWAGQHGDLDDHAALARLRAGAVGTGGRDLRHDAR